MTQRTLWARRKARKVSKGGMSEARIPVSLGDGEYMNELPSPFCQEHPLIGTQ